VAAQRSRSTVRTPGTSRTGLLLRSLLFALGLVVSTLIFAPLSLLTFPLPYLARYRFITGWTRFNLWWLGRTCRLHHRFEGLENVPPRPAIVFSRHESAWETMALQYVFSPQVWVLKRELLWIPFFGWGLAMLRPIAIDRRSRRRAIEQIVEIGGRRLQEGCWVVVFPEGTRVAPGKKRRYRIGGAVLAEKSGAPVVPVAHDAGDFWPRRSFIKHPGTIRVVIGPPIQSTGRSAAEINSLAEHWIGTTMARLRAGNAPPAGEEDTRPLPAERAGGG